MTLEKHIMDTMKEWQIKLGSIGSDMKLYYPKTSLYEYLKISNDISCTELCVEHEAGGATEVLYLKDETIEPYVYYIEQNEFGITYHRFTSNEYKNL